MFYNNWKTNNACEVGTWSWLFILLVSYFFKTVNQEQVLKNKWVYLYRRDTLFILPSPILAFKYTTNFNVG